MKMGQVRDVYSPPVARTPSQEKSTRPPQSPAHDTGSPASTSPTGRAYSPRAGARFDRMVHDLRKLPAGPDQHADTNLASTSRAPQRPRLVDLMHAERPSEMTQEFLLHEAYEAPSQHWSSGMSATSPGAHAGAESPAASEASLASEEPDWGATTYHDDAVPWQKNAKPQNLLWQKIDEQQKENILDAFNERQDHVGISLWGSAGTGDLKAMDALDHHLLLHYQADQFGKPNQLRFPPKPQKNIPVETTPEDTRIYMREKQPHMTALLQTLTEADAERKTNSSSSSGNAASRWFKSWFK